MHRARPTVLVLTIAAAAATAAGIHLLDDPPSAASPRAVVTDAAVTAPPDGDGPTTAPAAPPLDGSGDDAAGADGGVAFGTTPFDDVPAVVNLDPALLDALRAAADDAAADGVTIYVTSGWRSAAYQDRLLRDAVARYGSEAEAARWVATSRTSAHVQGDAVDVGRTSATDWLAAHGAGHGLCRVYDNEPWHYELRPEAADHGCPATYADPTQDPRMSR